ncbi:MAG: leucine-rich repeat domain-containing protein [Bacteroidales bacterium]|nr:leucine-rich repeat domain-containing protein [Bacteroidales bacterium]
MKMLLLIFLCSMASYVLAQDRSGSCGDGLTWRMQGSTVIISGNGPMSNFTTRYVGSDDMGDVDEFGEQIELSEKEKAKLRKKELKKKAKARKKGFVEDNFDHVIPWFDYRSYITQVVVEEGVTSIGDNAFKGFKELKTVILPESLETIGRESFYWCVKLDSIEMPNASTISLGAFSGCNGLKKVSFGRKMATIEKSAFYQCLGLRKVLFNGTTDDWFVIDFQSDNSNPLKYAGHLYIGDSEVTEISTPDTITVIPPYVCVGMVSLNSLTLGEAVVKISSHAFDGCRSLQTIDAKPVVAPQLERYAFLNTTIRSIQVKDEESKDSYRSTWGKRYSYDVMTMAVIDENNAENVEISPENQ